MRAGSIDYARRHRGLLASLSRKKSGTQMKRFMAAVTLALLVTLSACGGGESESLSTDAPPSDSPKAVSVFLTHQNPAAQIPAFAKVDFSRETDLMGQTVSIEQLDDPELDSVAEENGLALHADLSAMASLRVTLPYAPQTDEIEVVFEVPAAFGSLGDSRGAVVYALSSADVESGDGASTFLPLASDFETASRQVKASIPADYFWIAEDGTFEATLKLGLAELFEPLVEVKSTQQPGLGTDNEKSLSKAAKDGTTIPCPLKPCIETSLYNPKRVLEKLGSRPHFGIDLRASAETDLNATLAGHVIGGRSEAAYNYLLKKGKNGKPCTAQEIGKGSGVSLLVDVTVSGRPATLKYFHLTDIAGTLQKKIDKSKLTTCSAQGGLRLGKAASIKVGDLIGTTGTTGVAGLDGAGAHLHFELFVPQGKKSCTDGVCRDVVEPVDPFPYFVKQLHITSPSNKTTFDKGDKFRFKVMGKDSKGVNVYSVTTTESSATRYVCFSGTPDGAIQFKAQPNDPDGQSCYLWNDVAGKGAGALGTAIESGPDTTIAAKYTLDPVKSPRSATLSNEEGSVVLKSRDLSECPADVFSRNPLSGRVSYSATIYRISELRPPFSASGSIMSGSGCAITGKLGAFFSAFPIRFSAGYTSECLDTNGSISNDDFAVIEANVQTRPYTGPGTYPFDFAEIYIGHRFPEDSPGTAEVARFSATGSITITEDAPLCSLRGADGLARGQVNKLTYTFTMSGQGSEHPDESIVLTGNGSNVYAKNCQPSSPC